jgi:D-aminopeptidase
MTTSRARDLGVEIGRLPPGPLNAITDVAGVRVGHASVIREADGAARAVRTGVTAVFPHEGEPWRDRVYAGAHVLNGYGEMIGINQIREWGVLMSPIVLTSSLAIGRAYDATVRWIAGRDAEAAAEIMPVVSECDDGFLNDPLSFPLEEGDVAAALDAAVAGPVRQGNVGAGVGMQCFDFKGGIGTASRITPEGHTVGVLVLTNFGDRADLRIDGVPVGRAITDLMPVDHTEGSCVVVLATDAPLLPHQLRRLAARGGMGLARTGSYAANGSGEQMIAFATGNRIPVRSVRGELDIRAVLDGAWDGDNPLHELFAAAVEATDEAVVDAMFAAETTVGRDGNTLFALPVDRVVELLRSVGHLAR